MCCEAGHIPRVAFREYLSGFLACDGEDIFGFRFSRSLAGPTQSMTDADRRSTQYSEIVTV